MQRLPKLWAEHGAPRDGEEERTKQERETERRLCMEVTCSPPVCWQKQSKHNPAPTTILNHQ
jgi:hypothetical protein